MPERKLAKIELSEYEHHYYIILEYHNWSSQIDMWRPGLALPKSIDYLKGYLCGILAGSDEHDLDIQIENSRDSPLEEKVFSELTNFINAWTVSGLASD